MVSRICIEALILPAADSYRCAYMGLSAIIANIDETCMACAIREAYAAAITVVILTSGLKNENIEAVERSPPRPKKTRARIPTV